MKRGKSGPRSRFILHPSSFILFLATAFCLLPTSAHATVGYDAFSADDAEGTGNLAWNHVPSGTPKGIIVFIVQNAAGTDQVSGVTYGGTAMTECSGSPNLHATGETGVVYCYFLGSSVPTGTQEVAVTVSGAAVKFAYAISVTAVGDTAIVDSDGTIHSDSLTNVAVTLSLGGINSFAAIGFHSGENAPASNAPLTGWTARNDHDFGNQTGGAYTYDTIGTADVTAGWTLSADDAVMMAVAVKDTSTPQVGAAPVAMTVSPAAGTFREMHAAAAVSLANSPAATATTPVNQNGPAAVSLAIACPVCVDLSQPNAGAVALAIGPAVTATGTINQNGPAAVALAIAPGIGIGLTANKDLGISLGVSPAVATPRTLQDQVAAALNLAPAAASSRGLAQSVAAAVHFVPDATALSGKGASAAASLHVSPEAGAALAALGPAAGSLHVSPAVETGFVGTRTAAVAMAVNVSATAIVSGTRRTVVVVT